MGNLLKEDNEIKVSKSCFSTFTNESLKYEGKEITDSLFAYRIHCGFFKSIDIEILDAIYNLKYSTSRQITMYLNKVRNITIEQSKVSKRLTTLNNSSAICRYSFVNEERIDETNFKVYSLKNNGKRLLRSFHYQCYWNIFECVLLDDIKSILARNQFILKLINSNIISYPEINFKTDIKGVEASYNYKNTAYFIIPVRSNLNEESIINIFTTLNNSLLFTTSINKKIIIIGEDDVHLFNIFKIILKNKLINLNILFFTSDLRIIERDIEKCTFKFGMNKESNTVEIRETEF